MLHDMAKKKQQRKRLRPAQTCEEDGDQQESLDEETKSHSATDAVLPPLHTSSQFKCNFVQCKTLHFSEKTLYEKHTKTEHYGLMEPLRENEDKEVRLRKMSILKRAMKASKKLKCNKCGKSFISVLGYIIHYLACGEPPKLGPCELCGKVLKTSSMKAHMKIHEEIPPSQSEQVHPSTDVTYEEGGVRKKRQAAIKYACKHPFSRTSLPPISSFVIKNTKCI